MLEERELILEGRKPVLAKVSYYSGPDFWF
jgi:hypothetical protein